MQRDCSGRPLRLFLTFYRPHRRLFALDLLFSLLSCLADLAFPVSYTHLRAHET